jgi:hypothetical protein
MSTHHDASRVTLYPAARNLGRCAAVLTREMSLSEAPLVQRRKPWLWVAAASVGLLGTLFAFGGAYLGMAGRLPAYAMPAAPMPAANAYDDFVAAAGLAPGPQGVPVGPPDASATERLRARVTAGRRALARLRQGFGKPYQGPPLVSFSQVLPELSGYRQLGQDLMLEGALAEQEGRPADAARSYLDCARFGVEVTQGGGIVHGSSGIIIQMMGLEGLQRLANRLDGDTAARAARELARYDRRAVPFADMLVVERDGCTQALLEFMRQHKSWHDAAAIIGTPPQTLGDEIVGSVRYALLSKRRVVEDFRGYMDEEIARARKPYYARPLAPSLPPDPVNQMIAPVYEGVELRWAGRDAEWRVTEARLALRTYEANHGAPPPTLRALAPEVLPAVPQDPFTPGPLRYRPGSSAARVYSVGPDGVDDGGKDLGANVQAASHGDIASVHGLKWR